MDEALDVLVLSEDASLLSAALVRAMRSRGVGIVGLYDPDDGPEAGAAVLRQHGIDIAVAGDAPAGQLLEAVRTAQPDMRGTFDDLVSDLGTQPVDQNGVVLAVGGPPGSGGTELAVGMATVVAESSPTVLVDCDERRPSIVQRLHRALNPNIQALVDELRGGMSPLGAGDDDVPPAQRCLAVPAAHAAAPSLPFNVLGGLSNPRAWAELRPEDVRFALESVRAISRVLVADIGGDLEDLSRHGIDRAPLSRGAVELADAAITVCEASPRGVVSFLDWRADLAAFNSPAPTHVVMNRCPRDQSLRQSLVDQLTDVLGVNQVWELPDDRRVRRASWDGLPVSRGKWMKQVRHLVGHVAQTVTYQPQPGAPV